MSAIGQRMMDAVIRSCEETEEQLSERLEHELRGLRRLRVSLHLLRCYRCRALMRSLTRTVDQIRDLGRTDFAPPAADSVIDDVVARIRRERR